MKINATDICIPDKSLTLILALLRAVSRVVAVLQIRSSTMQHECGAFELVFRNLFVRCLHRLSANDSNDTRSTSSQSQVVLTDTCSASGQFDSLSGHCGACEFRGCLFENKHQSQLRHALSRDVFKRRAASSSKASISTSSVASRCSTENIAHADGDSIDTAITPAGLGCCSCSDGAMMVGTFSGDSSYGCGFLALGSAGR